MKAAITKIDAAVDQSHWAIRLLPDRILNRFSLMFSRAGHAFSSWRVESFVPASPARFLALAIIRCYQKWISPHKGFRCAYQKFYRRESCSNFGLRVFEQHPPLAAWRLLRDRLGECKTAYDAFLAAEPQQEEPNNSRQQKGTKGKSFFYYCQDSACDIGANCCGDLLNSLLGN